MTLRNNPIFRLKRLFKRDNEVMNIYHKELDGKTEPAFKADGVQYYRFVKDIEMYWGRYMFMQTFLYEQNLRMTVELLEKYMDKMEKALNPVKGVIELGKVYQVIGQIKSRCALGFEVETTYRLASILYFDDTEDLHTYDKPYNDKKIESWRGAKMVDFFYHKPMTEFLNLSHLLPADLQTFMEQQKGILEDLIYETPAP